MFRRRLNSPSQHVLEQGPDQTCGRELTYGLTYGFAQNLTKPTQNLL